MFKLKSPSFPRTRESINQPTMDSRIRGNDVLAAAVIAITLCLPLQAAEPVEKLMDEARCYACHDSKDAKIGPPWQAIAARHAANKPLMVDVLARKIVRGGGGDWGNVPMVPNQFTSIDEARSMAVWILDQLPKQK